MFPLYTSNMSRKDWLKLHPRSQTKHSASKRGYKHAHRMSRGERKHAAYLNKHV